MFLLTFLTVGVSNVLSHWIEIAVGVLVGRPNSPCSIGNQAASIKSRGPQAEATRILAPLLLGFFELVGIEPILHGNRRITKWQNQLRWTGMVLRDRATRFLRLQRWFETMEKADLVWTPPTAPPPGVGVTDID